ncbi:MAG: hypothetical protein LBQ31_04050 [Bacteroidales bacterium]|nr:hypothetical protein [Bacteroidales bacterium]
MGVSPPLASSWWGRAFTPIFLPAPPAPVAKRISAQSLTQPNSGSILECRI